MCKPLKIVYRANLLTKCHGVANPVLCKGGLARYVIIFWILGLWYHIIRISKLHNNYLISQNDFPNIYVVF